MTRCLWCNWTPHDLAVHEDVCRNGHPRDIVGTYTETKRGLTYRRCRQCQRDSVKRYDDAHREQRRAAYRRWQRRRTLVEG